MQVFRYRLVTSVAAALTVAAAGFATSVTAAPSARSQLYSVAAVNKFCVNAQKLKVQTSLTPLIINHTDIDSFTYSSPAPYDGYNISAYNGKTYPPEDDPDPRGYATTLPFTNQAFVTHGEMQPSGLQIPIVISCKMKAPKPLKAYYGAGAAGVLQPCSSINQDTITKVFASLTTSERRYLRFNESQIVLDPDQVEASGPDWLFPLTEGLPPTVAYIGGDGFLHLKAKATSVPQGSDVAIITEDKKGTAYCHFIAPEYLRGLVTGQVQPLLTAYSPNH